MTIQEIAKKAKEIRKKHPEYKWTDCIKLASGKKITAGKTEPKRRKPVKAETRSAVSKKKKVIKKKNPSAGKKPADKVFKKFMHKAPNKHQTVDIGPIEKGLALIGKCSRLDYFSDKRIYKTDKELNRDVIREYTHEMVTPCNMYVSADGKTLVITMKKAVTAAGIIQ